HAELERRLTFVVVVSGPTGVEVAGHTQPIVQVWDIKQLTDWLSQWQQLKQRLSDLPEQSQQHYVNLSKIAGNLADPAKAFVKAQNIA
ncbi:hypothetical protein KC218_24380, partial [Mycobacterium tuberculosis]|nr:hypothetical protein [Mycobacterium tuberculosis]